MTRPARVPTLLLHSPPPPLQVVQVESGASVRIDVQSRLVQSRARAALQLCWSPPSTDAVRRFHVARANGTLESFEIPCSTGGEGAPVVRQLGGTAPVTGTLPGRTVGLHALPLDTLEKGAGGALVSCDAEGAVRVTTLHPSGAARALCDRGGFDAPAPISTSSIGMRGSTDVAVAVGGRENDVQVSGVSGAIRIAATCRHAPVGGKSVASCHSHSLAHDTLSTSPSLTVCHARLRGTVVL